MKYNECNKITPTGYHIMWPKDEELHMRYGNISTSDIMRVLHSGSNFIINIENET
jgi:hypothetical protein